VISLPRFEAFKNAAHFYSTAFHELAIGPATNRDWLVTCARGSAIGLTPPRSWLSKLCSAFLCAEFSVDGDLRHAGYIQNWTGLLKADSRAFFTACSKAQAAANYLRGLALSDRQNDAAA
jgi:antirestriction protein ArdC